VTRRQSRAGLAPLILLGLLVVAVHARALGSDLVYDGRSQIAEDDYLHQPGHLARVLTLRVLADDVLDGNRPTQLLSLMLDALVWGRRPFGFHLTNLVLHLGCVLLLFGLMRRWGAGPGPAAFGAALFAVHPLVVEVVAEPSYREDLLVGILLLAAARSFASWTGTWTRGDGARVLGILACALGAVAAKESGAAVAVILAAMALATPSSGASSAKARWTLVALVALVVTAFVVLRFALQPDPSAVFPVRPARLGGSLGATLLIQLRIFALYAGHLLWPAGLSADYTPGALAGIPALAGALALLLVLAAQALLVLRAPLRGLALLGSVWFWASLLPASNLLPMYRPAADRYLYVPLMGVAMLAAVALAWLWPRKLAAAAVLTALTVGLFACALASIARHGVFASELALWQDTLRVSPDSTTAMNNEAWALLDAHRLPEAQAGFARAVQATGRRDPDPLAGLAIAAYEQGRQAEARAILGSAVALDPTYGQPERLRRSMRLTRAQIERLRALLLP
jgi:hypothetical protein